jgi:transposase InsO family protein
VLRSYPTLNQATAIQFLDYVIQTDNGAEFQSAFHWHVLDNGIAHTYIKPRTPRLNGKIERSRRIDAEQFYRLLDGVIIDAAEVFNDKLREWEDYYNSPPAWILIRQLVDVGPCSTRGASVAMRIRSGRP